MSTMRDRVKSLQDERSKIDNQIGNLSQDSWKLNQEIIDIKKQIVLEENLLNGVGWVVELRNVSHQGDNTFYLTSEKYEEPKAVIELCREEWGGHWSCYLYEKGKDSVEFREDDGEITIGFSSDRVGLEFIKSQNLKVDASVLEDGLEDLKSSLDAYETLLREFGK